MTMLLLINCISHEAEIEARTFLAERSSTFLRSDRMVEPNTDVPRNVPESSGGERSNVPPPIYREERWERTPKRTSRAHDQEDRVTDIADLLDRERRTLPDHRRAGRKCASRDCTTRLYLVGRTRCRQCERREVNTSPDQRDSGNFAASGAA
jgi:hypothetical protein